VKVSDGDTIRGETPEKTKLKIRLYGIDAPEIAHGNMPGQPMGNESMAALSSKVLNRELRVEILDVDRHRRIVAMLWLGNRNINLEMVKEGYAEAYREYLKDPYRQMFLDAEGEAKAAKRGIWVLGTYERPSAFKARIRTGVN
jgi:endonuclease YncB( thermonuclease family)